MYGLDAKANPEKGKGAVMGRHYAGAIAVAMLTTALAVVGFTQQGGSNRQSSPTVQPPSNRSNYPATIGMPSMGGMDPAMGVPDVMNGRIAEQQARTRNSERQKKLESDTEKLVGLVSDLKGQIQNEKSISPADLSKRAEEIEKLARSVKDRMKG
jgi:hypothetical protein